MPVSADDIIRSARGRAFQHFVIARIILDDVELYLRLGQGGRCCIAADEGSDLFGGEFRYFAT